MVEITSLEQSIEEHIKQYNKSNDLREKAELTNGILTLNVRYAEITGRHYIPKTKYHDPTDISYFGD